ncbi:MAG: hypothetical protein WAV72_24815 [Bradyrhizobium sp.]
MAAQTRYLANNHGPFLPVLMGRFDAQKASGQHLGQHFADFGAGAYRASDSALASALRPRSNSRMPAPAQKITFAEMRAAGVRGLLIYCRDYRCSHWQAISGDRWPDGARLSDIEARFTCQACGKRGADVRPDFHWQEARRAVPA